MPDSSRRCHQVLQPTQDTAPITRVAALSSKGLNFSPQKPGTGETLRFVGDSMVAGSLFPHLGCVEIFLQFLPLVSRCQVGIGTWKCWAGEDFSNPEETNTLSGWGEKVLHPHAHTNQ